MAFDQSTRNRLQRFVSEARSLLTEEFTRQLQQEYGMDPRTGEVSDLVKLGHLDDARLEKAQLLGQLFAHYLASDKASSGATAKGVLNRIVREQAFTILNRLAALRMAETRGLLIGSVGHGYQAKGFQLYARLANTGLGETGDAYRVYLFSVFDELSQDLPSLFDRYSPQGCLFPREAALLPLLALINDANIDPIWEEDETIGWIYQYFNAPEERKEMREASSAPRNSREMSVRNQFFTPRYVVEFLTDNTLGRIWYEMRKGFTILKEECHYLIRQPSEVFLAAGGKAADDLENGSTSSQDELLRVPIYINDRPKKDPRDLHVLDPACGSGHFLLYAFDLLERMYEEAWEDPASPKSKTTGRALREEFETRDDLRRAVPKLIVEHNLYGVDIDARAVQIAALALWLRAQKAWTSLNLKASARPRIARSNIVTAEPMPGEEDMRREFITDLKPRVLGQLVDVVFEKMQLAGEAGSLLKIDEEITASVAEARRQWLKEPKPEQSVLFPELMTRKPEQGKLFDVAEITAEEFWGQAEERILAALKGYTERVDDGHAVRRRLFAGDATRGFAFIDSCRKHYDVVLMNPPFGQPTLTLRTVLKDRGSDGWKDLYAGFFEAALQFIGHRGLVGSITSSQYFHTRQLAKLRGEMVAYGHPRLIVDLGPDVLDGAAVQTALTVFGGRRDNGQMSYADLFEIDDKEPELRKVISSGTMATLSLDDLAAIPGQPFCLHASPNILGQWRVDTTLDPHTAVVATGNHTFDDERFLRLRHERVNGNRDATWFAFEKGGEFQPFLSPTSLLLRWDSDGAELRELNIAAYGSDAQVMQSSKYWKRPALCYTHVSSVGFSPRILQSDIIFSSESISIFLNEPEDHNHEYRNLALLGFLTSTAAQELIYVFGRYRKIENRAVSGMPISFVRLNPYTASFVDMACTGIALCLKLDALDETSPYFLVPDGVADRDSSGNTRDSIASDFIRLYEALDKLANQCLGISDSDLTATRRKLLVKQFRGFREIRTEADRRANMLMWSVGVAFGRFDWRLATGACAAPPKPDPFDPLPVKSPGMLPDGAEPFHRHAGILVDDQGQQHDLAHLMEEVLGRVNIPIPQDVRRWLQRDFFTFHLQRYSKSRRKAPIYWPLATSSGSYTLWLYYPNLTGQTLYTAVNDFVEPKLNQVSGEVAALLKKRATRSRAEEKQFEALQVFELELMELRDILLKIAPEYQPNHADGIQITAAPLWPLFRHKPWRKVLRETWAKLQKGGYDWAHLAMNYWPDRVREKCKTDKSIAIAHGSEDLYVEPEGKPRKKRKEKAYKRE